VRKEICSRERMLETIANREADHVPCCFMIFGALQDRCRDQFEFVERQLELGLDAVVDLPAYAAIHERAQSDYADLHGLPVRFHPSVEIKERREDKPDERYPILHKEYITPAGILRTAVNRTDDWIHGDHVPFLDDYLIPRSRKFLVTERDDLAALRYLLTPPSKADVEAFRRVAADAKAFAAKRGLLVTGGWGSVVDTACWLSGITELVLLAIDEPEFVKELFDLIADWNRQQMKVLLDEGVDLFIRRAWYESADFWSPGLYRQFILPSVKKDVEMVHQAGAKFGYIMTTGTMPLLDMLLEADIDVLIGVDPVQGKGTDLRAMKQKLSGKICLWGGVNGFITVERGTQAEVREAVETAIEILAPGGGFILSPVDNIRDNSPGTWANVEAFIEAWKRVRK